MQDIENFLHKFAYFVTFRGKTLNFNKKPGYRVGGLTVKHIRKSAPYFRSRKESDFLY